MRAADVICLCCLVACTFNVLAGASSAARPAGRGLPPPGHLPKKDSASPPSRGLPPVGHLPQKVIASPPTGLPPPGHLPKKVTPKPREATEQHQQQYEDPPEEIDGPGPTSYIHRHWNHRHDDHDQQPTDHYGPEEYYSQGMPEYKHDRSCGGRLPPPCSTPSRVSPDYRDTVDYKDSHYYASDPYAPSYSTKPCGKTGAAYAWSAQCAQPTQVGDTCKGVAFCQRTHAYTSVVATCTAWGWVAKDTCKPAGCSSAPVSQLATFAHCKTPGVLEQECRGTCTDPSVGGPVATCTANGWVISGPLCDLDACEALPAPCDSNATCTDNPPPALDANCSCLPGFFGNGLPGNCTEIDACAASPSPCDANATCSDELPPSTGATCACKEGFFGSGLPGNCTEIDACAAVRSPCDINADCVDNPPPSTNATCQCRVGFIGDGTPGNCVEEQDACTPENNPCSPDATCTDRDPPLSGADCVCKPNFSGNGTQCTACTGTTWSPGGNVPCTDFSLHSQFFGDQPAVSQARSLRGLATDGTSLYVGMIRGSNSADVIKVTAATTDYLIGNGPTPVPPNPYFNAGVLARAGGFPEGPKGLTLDDAGYVYHTNNNGRVFGRDPNTANLALLAQTFGGPGGTDLGPIPEALAFKRLSGVPYLYACVEGNPVISRLEIIYNAAGQPVSFLPRPPVPFTVLPAPNGCRGISIEDDGTLYYTSVAPGGGNANYYVAKVAPDGTELARATVPGAFGVAHYNGNVYVTQFLSTNTAAGGSVGSGVAVLKSSNLTFITTLKPPAALARVFQDNDSGYSGIAVSPTGMLYVADQRWKTVANGAGNTPLPFTPSPVATTANPITVGTWLFDRVLQRQL